VTSVWSVVAFRIDFLFEDVDGRTRFWIRDDSEVGNRFVEGTDHIRTMNRIIPEKFGKLFEDLLLSVVGI
jgi:hypothetical protein